MLAARALGPSPGEQGLLLALTRDPQWRVREAACRPLGDEDARVVGAAECALDHVQVKEFGAPGPQERGVS